MIRRDSFTGRNMYATRIHVFSNVKTEVQCQDVSMTEKGLSLSINIKTKYYNKERAPASAIGVFGVPSVENVNAKKIASAKVLCSALCLTVADTNLRWK